MGQWVTPVMGFLPANFKIPTPFYSTPRVRQTERRTDGETDNGHRCIMPTVWGPGMKKNLKLHSFVKLLSYFGQVDNFYATLLSIYQKNIWLNLLCTR